MLTRMCFIDTTRVQSPAATSVVRTCSHCSKANLRFYYFCSSFDLCVDCYHDLSKAEKNRHVFTHVSPNFQRPL